jgi:hypothetical protein
MGGWRLTPGTTCLYRYPILRCTGATRSAAPVRSRTVPAPALSAGPRPVPG